MGTALMICGSTFWPTTLADSWLDCAMAAAAIVAFVWGLSTYAAGRRWDRTRFLAEFWSAFRSNPRIGTAFSLIDDFGGKRRVELFPENEHAVDRVVEVSADQVVSALRETDPDGDRICDGIRDCFDQFLDGLERLECFIRAGVIDARQLRPLVEWWVHQLAETKNSKKGDQFVDAAMRYVARWYPGEVIEFLARFGCVVPPPCDPPSSDC